LEEEFARLKRIIPLDDVDTVCWKPELRSSIHGEVVNGTVYVYDTVPQAAVDTLKHEYIDCLLTRKMVDPLITMVNAFIKLKEREVYKEKERIVDYLVKLT
jgi:hypothetical protein